jgi:ABC-type sugar transport system ATPase subunit
VISVNQLHLRQGEFKLDDISFDVPTGRFAALMGKTGSGKTSVLEAICGLRPVASGTIKLCDQDVTGLRTSERGIGYVPQDGVLFGNMTVREHLSFALRIRKWTTAQIDARVSELAELLELSGLLERTPQGLSGGEVQRVSLGRALSFQPSILLLDEPLSALDDDTREQMYDVIRRVRQFASVTALHVTHNRTEANELGDMILTLRDGSVHELNCADKDRKTT